jgi:hypothetical protein
MRIKSRLSNLERKLAKPSEHSLPLKSEVHFLLKCSELLENLDREGFTQEQKEAAWCQYVAAVVEFCKAYPNNGLYFLPPNNGSAVFEEPVFIAPYREVSPALKPYLHIIEEVERQNETTQ